MTIAVAVYRRAIAASLARIWENVLDWEHLPWLHRSAFASIEPLECHSNGWCARVGLTSAPTQTSLVDVQLDRPHLRYWTRTLEGTGAGTEILTTLAPVSDHCTDIQVAFHVPGVAPQYAAKVGEAYTLLYKQLWDEDEAMMIRRRAVLEARQPPKHPSSQPLRLGTLTELRQRLPLVVDAGGRRCRVVDVGGELVVYSTQCPHLGGPLEEAPLDGPIVTCPWHGYRFDVRSGQSCNGRELCLDTAPMLQIDQCSDEVQLIWR